MIATRNEFRDKMFLMTNMLSIWLNAEMVTRGWSQSDLARRSGLHRAVISKILSDSSKPIPETCRALAVALKLPIEQVYRAAGLLPPKAKTDELAERAEHLYNLLAPENQRKALEYLEFLKIQEERGDYRVTKTKTVETG